MDLSVDYWKKAQQLEAGRNEVLRLVAKNEPLTNILSVLCQQAKIYNPEMICSILEYNDVSNTLHPKAAVGLPDFYCQALEGVVIGPGVGSCGTAAAIKDLVIVEDINTHPYWNQFKELALKSGVQACWSHPIIDSQGKLYGTYAIYYAKPKAPSKEDLQFIELNAYIATIIYENHDNRMKVLEQNKMLSQSLDERSQQLFLANQELNRIIFEQKQAHNIEISSEKSQTTNSLIAGFSHEISTPINNAQLSVHAIYDKALALKQAFNNNQISRQQLKLFINSIEQLANISDQSLMKVIELLNKFRMLNFNDTLNQVAQFSLATFFEEVIAAKQHLIANHHVSVSCTDVDLISQKDVLWQVFSELIDNSILHGFAAQTQGTIHIHALAQNGRVVINIQDDGQGITDEIKNKIFSPFFTQKRHLKMLGLGLNLVENALSSHLGGSISIEPSPKGSRFKIELPQNLNSPN